MRIRSVLASMTAIALCGCAAGYDATQTVHVHSAPAVTQSTPAQMASLDPSDSILFWNDARRSAAFRSMETMFPGLEVAPASQTRHLPDGKALSADQEAAVRTFMAETSAAGVMVLQDGKVRFEDYALGLDSSDRWTSFSVAKSFTSTLLGAAKAACAKGNEAYRRTWNTMRPSGS